MGSPVPLEAYCESCSLPPEWLSSSAWQNRQKGEILDLLPLIRCCGGGKPAALSIDRSGEVFLWDVESRQGRAVFQLPGAFDASAVSPTGRRLAVARGSQVTIFELRPGGGHIDLTRLRGNIASLDFDPEERSLLLGSADGKLYRWKFSEEGKPLSIPDRARLLERYHGLETIISTVAYHPFGRVFFSGDWNGSLVAWSAYDTDPYGGEYDTENLFAPRFFAELATLKAGQSSQAERVEQLQISDDGRAMVLVLQNGFVEFWKVRGFTKVAEVQAHTGLVYGMAVAPDAEEVATVGRDGVLKWWTVQRKKQRDKAFELVEKGELPAPDLRVLRYLDSTVLLGGTREGGLFVLDAEQRRIGEEAVASAKAAAAASLVKPTPTPPEAAATPPPSAATPTPAPAPTSPPRTRPRKQRAASR